MKHGTQEPRVPLIMEVSGLLTDKPVVMSFEDFRNVDVGITR